MRAGSARCESPRSAACPRSRSARPVPSPHAASSAAARGCCSPCDSATVASSAASRWTPGSGGYSTKSRCASRQRSPPRWTRPRSPARPSAAAVAEATATARAGSSQDRAARTSVPGRNWAAGRRSGRRRSGRCACARPRRSGTWRPRQRSRTPQRRVPRGPSPPTCQWWSPGPRAPGAARSSATAPQPDTAGPNRPSRGPAPCCRTQEAGQRPGSSTWRPAPAARRRS